MKSKNSVYCTLHENVTYPYFDVSHKTKCMKCKYHSTLSGGFSLWNVICNYLLITGKRRPCPANECTVFEAGRAKRTLYGEMYINNF